MTERSGPNITPGNNFHNGVVDMTNLIYPADTICCLFNDCEYDNRTKRFEIKWNQMLQLQEQ